MVSDNFHCYWYISGEEKKKKAGIHNDSFHSVREALFLWCLGTSQEKSFFAI